METSIILIILVLAVLGLVMLCRSKFTSTSEKVSLNQPIDNTTVLIFYAPWCGHCKRSKKDFEEAQEQGQGKVKLIDATNEENDKLVTKYNIQGFPTIIKGDGTKYPGPRTAKDIIEFSKK